MKRTHLIPWLAAGLAVALAGPVSGKGFEALERDGQQLSSEQKSRLKERIGDLEKQLKALRKRVDSGRLSPEDERLLDRFDRLDRGRQQPSEGGPMGRASRPPFDGPPGRGPGFGPGMQPFSTPGFDRPAPRFAPRGGDRPPSPRDGAFPRRGIRPDGPPPPFMDRRFTPPQRFDPRSQRGPVPDGPMEPPGFNRRFGPPDREGFDRPPMRKREDRRPPPEREDGPPRRDRPPPDRPDKEP